MNEVPRRSQSGYPFLDWLFVPTDIAWLAYFRIVFGATIISYVYYIYEYRYIEHFVYLGTAPNPVIFPYRGLEWISPLPGDAFRFFFPLMGALGALIVLGLAYRLAAILTFLAFTYVFFLDKVAYQNHYYLIFLLSLLMIFMPAHRAFSLDALLRPKIRCDTAPLWTLWLMRIQIGIVYFYAGIAKINTEWLSGRAMLAQLAMVDSDKFGPLASFVDNIWFAQFFSQGGLWLDLLVVYFLIWSKTRPYAYFVTLFFHSTNKYLFDINFFPPFMIAATLIYFDPGWPRRLLRRRPLEPASSLRSGAAVASVRRKSITAIVLGLYMAFQLVFPFRHFAYPGSVIWTGEGKRFAWHLRLNSRDVNAGFLVTDERTGESFLVQPQDYMQRYQFLEMKTPEMFVQFARFIERAQAREGRTQIQVRALLLKSLNAGPMHFALNPNVDLLDEDLQVVGGDWIFDEDTTIFLDGVASEFLTEIDQALRRSGLPINTAPFSFAPAH